MTALFCWNERASGRKYFEIYRGLQKRIHNKIIYLKDWSPEDSKKEVSY
jgi:hypothetical protein